MPDWRALKKCLHLFPKDKKTKRPIYITGPWEKSDVARALALGFNVEIKRVKDSSSLWPYLETAYSKKEPILILNWIPNWSMKKYDGKFVEFPEYDKKCKTDMSWGINPKAYHDCGSPKKGWLKKAAWSGINKKWSCAYQILKKMNFNDDIFNNFSYDADIKKAPMNEIANNWLENNKDIWKNWVGNFCQPL